MKTTTLLTASLGTVSHGTLRTEDLLSEFISELEWQMARNGDFFSSPENFGERDRLSNILGEAQAQYSEDGETLEDYEAADEVVESLQESLSTFAGPYCYFGTHEGDGSDFGFWPSSYDIDELPTVEDSDAAIELGEDCKSVNDHGNVTVYSGSGKIILELV